MKLNTYEPCGILKPYIKSLAIAETTQELTYTVLPDTGLTICFQFKIKRSHAGNVGELLVHSSGLAGIQDRYRTYTTSADTGALLVHFKAGRSSAFFRQPMHELFGGSVLLHDLMLQSELHILEEQLSETLTDIGKINIAEQFLISKMNPGSPDSLVLSALELIQHRKGNVSIRELLSELYVSQSSLEKRFRHIVGVSPKKFTSIVRFRNIIQNYHPQASLSALGFEAGYYDQSHFIKAFKSFTGETPEIFFSKK